MRTVKTLRELRIEAHLSQEQVASAIGRTTGTINRYERGTTKIPLSTLNKLQELFGVKTIAAPKFEGKPDTKEEEAFETVRITLPEIRFLKTCHNMRDALYEGRMSVRDVIDATYEFMLPFEAVTYLYKWSKIGFYHFSKGDVVDRGYFLWNKLPPKYKRQVIAV